MTQWRRKGANCFEVLRKENSNTPFSQPWKKISPLPMQDQVWISLLCMSSLVWDRTPHAYSPPTFQNHLKQVNSNMHGTRNPFPAREDQFSILQSHCYEQQINCRVARAVSSSILCWEIESLRKRCPFSLQFQPPRTWNQG